MNDGKQTRLTSADIDELDAGLRTGRITLVLKSGKELSAGALVDEVRALKAELAALGTPEGNLLRFNLVKALALRAVREEKARDPHNLHVQDMEKLLGKVTTVAELDGLLRDEHEDDWLEGFILGRIEELVNEITAPFTISSHGLPATGKPTQSTRE